jgi:hypothetical protein
VPHLSSRMRSPDEGRAGIPDQPGVPAAMQPPVPAARGLRAIPATERPRERLAARGVAGLTGAELVALVWGSGARGRSVVALAEEALARHDGLAGLARASELELTALPGVGTARPPSWRPPSSSAVASWPTGRPDGGRSGRPVTWPTGWCR